MGIYRDDYIKKKRYRHVWLILAMIVPVVFMLILIMPSSPGRGGAKTTGVKPSSVSRRSSAQVNLDLPTMVKEVKGSVATIATFDRANKPVAVATGFVINENGHIITNRHVFQGAAKANVKIGNRTFPIAGFLAEDTASDLVLVAVSGTPEGGWKGLPCSDAPAEVGEKIFVVGNPLGLELTVSDGIVSAQRNLAPFGDVIQVTSPISPGSSGSPVLNMRGEVIGVATFQSALGQNLNFAIPIQKAVRLKPAPLQDLAKMKPETSAALGKIGDPLDKADYLVEHQEYEAAIPYCEQVLSHDFGNARAHCILGACYVLNKPDRARKELKLALEMKPDLAEAHYYSGWLNLELKQYDEAIASLAEAHRLAPAHFDTLLALGAAYFYTQRYRGAVDLLQQALVMKDNARLRTLLGLAYARISRELDAIRSFERAIELDEEDKEAYIGMAYVLARVKNWKLGIRHMTTAMMKWPKAPEMHFLLGLFFLGDGDLEAAQAEDDKLLKMNGKEANESRNRLESAIADFKYRKQLRDNY